VFGCREGGKNTESMRDRERLQNLVIEEVIILSHIPRMGDSVTNNSTWIRIGYRIFSLWRFITATGYSY
jgi:hypothetical protein